MPDGYGRRVEREKLRSVFDEDADLYDRMRPGYPGGLFDDLARWTGAGPGASVLEIGAGTGQATRSLAARGHRVTAVELGPALAARARRNLAQYPGVEVVTADFERWTPPTTFDLVFAATAFHWLDPRTRAGRAAEALRPGGALAVVSTDHVAGGSWTPAFCADIQARYERWDPATPPGLRMTEADDVDALADLADVAASARFGPPATSRHTFTVTYPTAAYLDVLRTYSGHRALPPSARDGLFADIARLIDTHHDGRVTKRYLNVLAVFPVR